MFFFVQQVNHVQIHRCFRNLTQNFKLKHKVVETFACKTTQKELCIFEQIAYRVALWMHFGLTKISETSKERNALLINEHVQAKRICHFKTYERTHHEF